MTEIKILTDLPKHYKRRYPFNTMEPGDTILLPREDRLKLASAAANYGKRHNIKFVTRLYDHDGKTYAACQREKAEEDKK